jgi:hypothetical protein
MMISSKQVHTHLAGGSCNRGAHRIFFPPGQIRRNFACWVPVSQEEMTLYSVRGRFGHTDSCSDSEDLQNERQTEQICRAIENGSVARSVDQ